MIQHLESIKRELLADKKKLGFMVVLLFFGLLMWGRLLLKDVPKSASASSGEKVASASDDVNQSTKRASKVEVVYLQINKHLSRDLFAFDPSRYKRNFTTDNQDSFVEGGNFTQEPAEEQVSEVEALTQARRLTLSSVVTGRHPRAIIDDLVLAPGDQVEGFGLIEVGERFVILEKRGVYIRLWM